MTKTILYLSFVLMTQTINSQKQPQLLGRIDYHLEYNIRLPVEKEFVLLFNVVESDFEEQVDPDYGPNKNVSGWVRKAFGIDEMTGTTPSLISYNRSLDKMVYSSLAISNEYFLVETERFKRELLADTMTIGGYKCQKAKGFFRGRAYTAWFTPDIPVAFGPWKATGLNGIILQLSENTGMFRATATKINLSLKETPGLSRKVAKRLNLKIISVKQFFKLKEKELDELISKVISRLPKGVRFISRSYNKEPGLEIFYELEQK